VFWIGFAIPAFVIGWNIIGYFEPLLPPIRREFTPISLGRDFPRIPTNIYFVIIGFGYLIPLNISLGIWVFFLLSVIQVGVSNRIGVHVSGADVYCSGYASMGWEGLGALIVLVLWGLWMARKHLADVARCGLRGIIEEEDRNQLLSRRAAFRWLLVSVIYILFFLWKSGTQISVRLHGHEIEPTQEHHIDLASAADPAHHPIHHGDDIAALIGNSALEPHVRSRALKVFQRLTAAEARVHGTDPRFHSRKVWSRPGSTPRTGVISASTESTSGAAKRMPRLRMVACCRGSRVRRRTCAITMRRAAGERNSSPEAR
jgi:hypothetical protein